MIWGRGGGTFRHVEFEIPSRHPTEISNSWIYTSRVQERGTSQRYKLGCCYHVNGI